MKSFILSVLISISFNLIGQNNFSVTLCDAEIKNKTITLNQKELSDCRELKCNNDEWDVISFTTSISTNNTLKEFKNKGSIINSNVMYTIEKYSPKKVFLEKIILMNKAGKKTIINSLVIEIIY